jgi:phage protein U
MNVDNLYSLLVVIWVKEVIIKKVKAHVERGLYFFKKIQLLKTYFLQKGARRQNEFVFILNENWIKA